MKRAMHRKSRSVRLGCVLAAGACAAALPAWAQLEPVGLAGAAALADQKARLEVTTSRLPRIEGLESTTRGPRLDLTVLPRSRSAVGLALGVGGYAPPVTAAGPPGLGMLNFDVGVHLRHTTDNNYQVEVSAWRRMGVQPELQAADLVPQQQAAYVTRVELSLPGGPGRRFLAERGFLGFQLENGARLGLRRKDGGAMVYYRVKW